MVLKFNGRADHVILLFLNLSNIDTGPEVPVIVESSIMLIQISGIIIPPIKQFVRPPDIRRFLCKQKVGK